MTTKTTTISVKLVDSDLGKLDALVAAAAEDDDWRQYAIDPESRWRSRYGPRTRGEVLRALIRSAPAKRRRKGKK